MTIPSSIVDDDNPYRSPCNVEDASKDDSERPDPTFSEWVRRSLPCLLFVPVAGLPLLAWLLFEFQRMPYRPPHDMSTFLGKGEREAVWMLIVLVMVVWLGIVSYLVLRHGMRYRARRARLK